MKNNIIVALDYSAIEPARTLVNQLDPALCRLKIGSQMFTLFGPALVSECMALGFDVFLDLKFHDIPHTVACAISAACDLGVWMVNVHVQGGMAMLEAARKAVDQHAHRPLLIAVTVLTSLDDNDLNRLGTRGKVEDQVSRFAGLAYDAGLDGVVCSAREAPLLRSQFKDKFVLVTPSIRWHSGSEDQKRVVSPQQAIEKGSDYLVIGRSITQQTDPLTTLKEISQSMND